jgi:hypothetical protein
MGTKATKTGFTVISKHPGGEELRFEIAGARLLGQDAAAVLSEDTRTRGKEILESGQRKEELTRDIITLSGRHESGALGQMWIARRQIAPGFLAGALGGSLESRNEVKRI